MSDVDGLLERLNGLRETRTDDAIDVFEKRASLANCLPQIIATIERQRSELSAKQRRIELLESKLDAWHDLYGSEDWRSVLAAEMEADPC